jgi:signal transduction histidine kinase
MWRVVAAASACAILLLVGAGGLVIWAASAVDRIQIDKETALVERRVERLGAAMVDDLQSATIWNDAVVAVEARDMAWLQVNFGDYYADYMDHEVTLVHDAEGALILASRESEPVTASDVAAMTAATAPLLEQVRRDARDPRRRRGVAFEAVASRTGVVTADGEAWLVAASSVAPEDESVARPAADAVVVSAKPLSAVVDSLGADLKLEGAAFTSTDPGDAGVAVAGPDGRRLGWLTWRPSRPGTAVVVEAAPYLIALLLVLGAAAVGLVIWLRRTGARLALSEAALIEARDRAEAASEAKSRFLANMSHELRTPLNGVVAMSEIIALGELSPVQRERLDVLRGSGQDLLRMIEHLLQVTRLEKGHVLVAREAYDPAEVARAAVDRQEAAAQAKGLSLDVRLAQAGARLGDGKHVAQVLDYLLDNAVAYTRSGGVRLSLHVEDDRLRFEVSDTGPGIPADLLPRVFDVFTRGDDSLTSASSGAGLGLSICRNLVEAMGGRIEAHSAPGEGTRFVVDLPAPVAERLRERLAA